MALRSEFITWLKARNVLPSYEFYAQEMTGTNNQLVIADYGGVNKSTTPDFVCFMQLNLYHTNRLTAENDINTLYKFLHQHEQILLPTYRIDAIYANQYPFELPKEILDNDRALYHRVFNIQLYTVERI